MFSQQILLRALQSSFAYTAGRCKYAWDVKPACGLPADKVLEADCSGWVRWALYAASSPGIMLPLGHIEQRGWCVSNGLHELEQYNDVRYAVEDSRRLFWAFFDADETESAGHTWLVWAGGTMECYGGHGVGRRPWDTPVLTGHRPRCFELPINPIP